jgi:hypothetical protein
MGLIPAIAITLVVFAPIFYLVWRMQFRSQFVVGQALRRLPKKTIGALAEGERCYVVGTARAIELTKASGSGRPCILYATRLQVMSNSSTWDSVAMGSDFELSDGSGEIRVVGNGVVDADLQTTWHGTIGEERGGKEVFGASVIKREAANLGAGSGSWLDEGIIADGQRIAVAGTVERAADGSLRLVGRVDAPLLVVDRGKALR